jgi:hypothetical protein
LTYHTFLMVKEQNKTKSFCRLVDIMYSILSTVLYRYSEWVVNQGLHVSASWGHHKGDACVTRASHVEGLCITNSKFQQSGHGSQAMPNNSNWYSSLAGGC